MPTFRLPIGNDIVLADYLKDGQGLFYINLHEDESTSVVAAKHIIKIHGGQLVNLRHQGTQNIRFKLKDQEYVFDPNRIFTDKGIKLTLEKNSQYSDEAVEQIKILSRFLIKEFIQKSTCVIAVHNNIGGKYGITDYLPDQRFAQDAAEVFYNKSFNPGNFLLVTDPLIFKQVKELKLSVVLQDNDQVTDDGSLSVYCAQHGIQYINCEADIEFLADQIAMLKAVNQILNQG